MDNCLNFFVIRDNIVSVLWLERTASYSPLIVDLYFEMDGEW